MPQKQSVEEQRVEATPTRAFDRTRRMAVRVFFCGILVCMIAAVIPHQSLPENDLKPRLHAALSAVGISQGSWSMFAPNPKVDNAWLDATITAPDGQVNHWTSPEWRHVGRWEKFYRFRELNFYSRLRNLQNRPGAEDFAKYLARIETPSSGSDSEAELISSGVRLIIPIEGGIPDPDEVTWMLYSETIARTPSRE